MNFTENAEVKGKADIWAQKGNFSTSDYATGTSAHAAAKGTLTPIMSTDCDVTYAATGETGTSIRNKISELTFRINRELRRLGSDPEDVSMYRELGEGDMSLEVDMTIDFTTTDEYDDFTANTSFTLEMDIPSGTNGKRIELTGGKWFTAEPNLRLTEPVTVPLHGEFTGITVTTL